jgi:predicted nucleic acid-binding protein
VSLAYFDTSALAKNYIREAGSARVRALLTSYEFLSSAIAPIELSSAIQRRHRRGEITAMNYNSLIAKVNADKSFWQLIEPVPQVLSKAEDLVVSYNIRTLDSIHLASALILQESLSMPLPFVSADNRQIEAARSCQLQTIAIS